MKYSLYVSGVLVAQFAEIDFAMACAEMFINSMGNKDLEVSVWGSEFTFYF